MRERACEPYNTRARPGSYTSAPRRAPVNVYAGGPRVAPHATACGV